MTAFQLGAAVWDGWLRFSVPWMASDMGDFKYTQPHDENKTNFP
jgi:hypothetical protein